MPAATRSWERGTGWILIQSLEEGQPYTHLDFGLLDSRTMRQFRLFEVTQFVVLITVAVGNKYTTQRIFKVAFQHQNLA